jgi:hypothetical protein
MRGYGGLERSLSACLHFVRSSEVDESLLGLAQDLDKCGIRCVYVDYASRHPLWPAMSACSTGATGTGCARCWPTTYG